MYLNPRHNKFMLFGRQPSRQQFAILVAILVLVTGDNDFVPPMKFARREGVQFALVTRGHKVHADLLEHSDFLLGITL